MSWLEGQVERQIREARERGEFDDLPGAGKPLDLGDPHDPNWWVKQLIERERLDMTGALPPPLALRKEAESFPRSLTELASEQQVREALDEFNERVRQSWRIPAVGPAPPIPAQLVDVDQVLSGWRDLRALSSRTAAIEAAEPPEQRPHESRPPLRRRLLRWLRRGQGG